ncbi:MAG: V-type ATPase 116kDa subunit family protein [Peptoniphilaceae bacterium]|nr:V-type ATPase 116kDa subunit family protein [Peptoniphilaceae bacterium]MDY6086275.1 V-type ATPase 116kDa subunit family protein [Peptoniphilaceae bacterium]
MAIVKMSKFRLGVFSAESEAVLRSLQNFDQVHVLDPTKEPVAEGDPQRELIAADVSREEAAVNEHLARLDHTLQVLQSYRPAPKNLVEKISNGLPVYHMGDAEAFDAAAALDQSEGDGATQTIEKKANAPDNASVSRSGSATLKNTPTRSRVADVVSHVRDLEEQKRQANEAQHAIVEKRRELSHWKALDVPVEMLHAPRTVRTFVGTIPARWTEHARQFVANHLWRTHMEVISGDTKNSYVFIMSAGSHDSLQEFLRDVNFQPVQFDREGTIPEQLDRLAQREDELKRDVDAIDEAFRVLAQAEQQNLALAYEAESARLKRIEAQKHFLTSSYLTFFEGYVPTKREDAFRRAIARVVDDKRMLLTVEPADPDDPNVPTLLENNALVKPFEDIVTTFSVPLYKEMDPSGLIAPWYILFFSVMLGDLGYGVLLLLGTTLALKFMHFKPKTEQSLRFFQILSIPTIIVGACFGSIFGGLIPMKPLILDPTKDFMTMIVFSLIIGLIHLLVGIMLKGVQLFREGKTIDIVYDVVSWLLLLVGLVVAGLTKILGLPAVGATVGFAMAIVGALLVLFFSARDEKGGARFAWGLYNLYGTTSYVGDLVSYTRLTAIMLAGAYIGFAMNMIAGLLTGIGIPGFIIAGLILVGAHLFNLFLSTLSSYVHSMRLIYVEFFGKFFEGGGTPFRGLRPEPKYIDVRTAKPEATGSGVKHS